MKHLIIFFFVAGIFLHACGDFGPSSVSQTTTEREERLPPSAPRPPGGCLSASNKKELKEALKNLSQEMGANNNQRRLQRFFYGINLATEHALVNNDSSQHQIKFSEWEGSETHWFFNLCRPFNDQPTRVLGGG